MGISRNDSLSDRLPVAAGAMARGLEASVLVADAPLLRPPLSSRDLDPCGSPHRAHLHRESRIQAKAPATLPLPNEGIGRSVLPALTMNPNVDADGVGAGEWINPQVHSADPSDIRKGRPWRSAASDVAMEVGVTVIQSHESS